LADAIRNDVSIGWTVRTNFCAGGRVIVGRILSSHRSSTRRAGQAPHTVLAQVELLVT